MCMEPIDEVLVSRAYITFHQATIVQRIFGIISGIASRDFAFSFRCSQLGKTFSSMHSASESVSFLVPNSWLLQDPEIDFIGWLTV